MGRRFVVVLCACAVIPLLVFAFVAARTANSFGFAAMDRGLTAVSQSNSRGLRSRLGAAETIVQTLTARDVGYDGSALKQQVVNSRAIRSVVVVDRDGLLAGGDAALRPTSAATAVPGSRPDRAAAPSHSRDSFLPCSWRAP